MSPDLVSYEWSCPVCSKRKTGLSATQRVDVEAQARNAVECHVRTTSGGGHGPAGRHPPGFDPADAGEYVESVSDLESTARGDRTPAATRRK